MSHSLRAPLQTWANCMCGRQGTRARRVETDLRRILRGWILAALLAALDPTSALAAETTRDQVVFVCEYGSVKSLMAAIMFEAKAREAGLALHGVARGVKPDEHVPDRIVEALRTEGVDVSSFKPQPVRREDADRAVRIIAIAIDPSMLGTHGDVERWDDIPSSGNYAAAKSAIQRRVDELIDRLRSKPPYTK